MLKEESNTHVLDNHQRVKAKFSIVLNENNGKSKGFFFKCRIVLTKQVKCRNTCVEQTPVEIYIELDEKLHFDFHQPLDALVSHPFIHPKILEAGFVVLKRQRSS